MFGFNKKKQSGQKRYIGDTKIPFEDDLIHDFEDEHKQLVKHFVAIETALAHTDITGIKRELGHFLKLLRSHLLKENLKLYVYLSHAVEHDPEMGATVAIYRKEMQGIGKTVITFANHYLEEVELDESMLDAFAEKLNAIKPILLDRIDNEENVLYPLYMPPESYH